MMNTNPGHIPPDFLIRFLSGECSVQEAARVQEWIEASAANKTEYAQFKAIWEMSPDAFPAPAAVDTHAAWAAVAARLDARDEPQQVVNLPQRRFSAWLKVAAVLLPLIGIGIWLLIDRNPTEPELLSLSTGQADTLLQLADGSGIHLNRNTKLRYLQSFDNPKREVFLEGEAFLQVVRDTSRPFVVHTPTLEVRVLGTEFNVKAIPGQEFTTVSVQSGSVAVMVRNRQPEMSDSVVLQAGDKGIYSAKSGRLEVVRAESGSDFFWMNHRLRFRATPLQEVFGILEECYAVTIVTRDSSVLSMKLSTEFQDQPVERVMAIIGESLELRLQKEGNTYVVTRPEN